MSTLVYNLISTKRGLYQMPWKQRVDEMRWGSSPRSGSVRDRLRLSILCGSPSLSGRIPAAPGLLPSSRLCTCLSHLTTLWAPKGQVLPLEAHLLNMHVSRGGPQLTSLRRIGSANDFMIKMNQVELDIQKDGGWQIYKWKRRKSWRERQMGRRQEMVKKHMSS